MRYVLSAVALAVIGLGAFGTAAVSGQDRSPVRTIKDGVLDGITLYVDKPPASAHAVIRRFSATDADIVKGEKKDETKTMQADGPRLLAERFVAKLKEQYEESE